MKNLRTLALGLLLVLLLGNKASAQMEENRTKIEMTLYFGGKTVVTELVSLSTSITRNYDEPAPSLPAKDSLKKEAAPEKPGSAYLTMEIRRISDDLLRIFSKKQNRFDGTITIVDTYGKLPSRTFKFKQAMLATYSEQSAAASYGESYGAGYFSITCPEVTINGIAIE
jgi:hypothetical protein